MSLIIPSVVESTQRGERSSDLYSRLLSNRIVFVGHAIGPEVANLVCAQILHLAAEREDAPMSLYVNSPGGEITAMLAVYDTMRHVDTPVHTTCFGQAAAAAAMLVAAGEPGHRTALPNARFLLHQPASQRRGQVKDLILHAREAARERRLVEEILANHTGRTVDEVRADTDRDLTLSAPEAVDYGLIDALL